MHDKDTVLEKFRPQREPFRLEPLDESRLLPTDPVLLEDSFLWISNQPT